MQFITYMVNLQIITLCLLLFRTICQLHADPMTSYLTDQAGRFVFYHGVNVVYKQFPYYPKTDSFDPMSSLSTEDFRRLNEWGFRAIRLFIAWEGFQPKQGQYNYTYLQKIKEIIRQAKKYDISIILDAHQDLYSRRFCGQGFPDWLVSRVSFPAPIKITLRYDQNGNPLKEDCLKIPFFKFYESDDVMKFSHDFFSNKNGMADKFIRMWLSVVGFFKGQENVIGYDLINEPSGGNAWKNPYDFIGPSVNNNKFLLPFYKRLAKAIRQVDQKKLILFEPTPADYLGGFFQTPSGPQFSNKDVLSYHTYCPFKNDIQSSSAKKCKIIDFLYMQQRIKNVKKLKCGSLMTQFGSLPETTTGLAQTKRVLSLADKYWQSWFWWQYKYYADSTSSSSPPWQQSFYYPNGSLQHSKVFTLSYPYAYFVCGTPISQSSSDSSYTLIFTPKKCSQLNTQIYINEQMYFAKGFTVSFNPACPGCILRNYRKNYYQIIVGDNAIGRKLQVRIGGYL